MSVVTKLQLALSCLMVFMLVVLGWRDLRSVGKLQKHVEYPLIGTFLCIQISSLGRVLGYWSYTVELGGMFVALLLVVLSFRWRRKSPQEKANK